MKKTRKVLNLIILIGFLVSNFLTPLSYAIDDLEAVISNDSEKSIVQEYSNMLKDFYIADTTQSDVKGQENEDNGVSL